MDIKKKRFALFCAATGFSKVQFQQRSWGNGLVHIMLPWLRWKSRKLGHNHKQEMTMKIYFIIPSCCLNYIISQVCNMLLFIETLHLSAAKGYLAFRHNSQSAIECRIMVCSLWHSMKWDQRNETVPVIMFISFSCSYDFPVNRDEVNLSVLIVLVKVVCYTNQSTKKEFERSQNNWFWTRAYLRQTINCTLVTGYCECAQVYRSPAILLSSHLLLDTIYLSRYKATQCSICYFEIYKRNDRVSASKKMKCWNKLNLFLETDLFQK